MRWRPISATSRSSWAPRRRHRRHDVRLRGLRDLSAVRIGLQRAAASHDNLRRYVGRMTARFYPELSEIAGCQAPPEYQDGLSQGLATARNVAAMSRELWQPNNNDAYSAAGLGANRLTLPANWGQIAPVDRDLRIFRAGALPLGMDCMRCSWRLWRARKIRTGGALARLVAIAVVLVAVMSAAQAQSPTPTPTPTPTPIRRRR